MCSVVLILFIDCTSGFKICPAVFCKYLQFQLVLKVYGIISMVFCNSVLKASKPFYVVVCSLGLIFGRSGSGKTTLLQVGLLIFYVVSLSIFLCVCVW